jgi:CRISPR-associated protein Cas2
VKQFLVVSYDISEDRRRIKIMKTLKNFGSHVQYSVFECRLESSQIEELRKLLKKLAARQDSVRLYFISQDDISRIEVLGSGDITPDSIFYLH